MTEKNFTCILCPAGCSITAEEMQSGLKISGNLCPRGYVYVQEEMTNPKRNITSSVLVHGGNWPLASVRTEKPVPKHLIMDVMNEIKKIAINAPVSAGDVVAEDLLGQGIRIVATRNVGKIKI